MAWAKVGTETLTGTSDNLDLTGITGFKFNQFMSHEIPSGNIAGDQTFNADGGSLYASRKSTNGAGELLHTSKAWIEYNSSYGTFTGSGIFTVGYVCWVSGEEKLQIVFQNNSSTAGAGTAPERAEMVAKYVPASLTDTFDSIKFYNAEGGDFASDSNVSVLGTD